MIPDSGEPRAIAPVRVAVDRRRRSRRSALKAVAYLMTGSVGLLSDALESLVNLAGALMALAMLTVAARPADDEHAARARQGRVLLERRRGRADPDRGGQHRVAAVERLLHPQPLERIGLGLVVSVAASLVNLGVALRAAARRASAPLDHARGQRAPPADRRLDLGRRGRRASARWRCTGWQWLDPIVALAVAANIVWTGVAHRAALRATG